MSLWELTTACLSGNWGFVDLSNLQNLRIVEFDRARPEFTDISSAINLKNLETLHLNIPRGSSWHGFLLALRVFHQKRRPLRLRLTLPGPGRDSQDRVADRIRSYLQTGFPGWEIKIE